MCPMSIPLPMETERLEIRPFVPETDAAAIADVYGDPEVMRFIPGGALGLDAIQAELDRHRRWQAARGFSSWALVERATGRLIGDVGFGIFEPTGDVELGYTLARDCWGRGYATEAAAVCLDAALAHLDVPRILAVVDAENNASMRVAERIGMERLDSIEAHGRPHFVFAHVR